MASRSKRASSRSRQGGSTLYGLLAGLLIGLVVAAAVAFYVTQAPVPFVDRATRDVARRPAPDPRNAPDPNVGLGARNAAATSSARASGVRPASSSRTPLPNNDDLGSLIATLDVRPSAPVPPARPAQPGTDANATYFLQIGAFRVIEDADALRARVLMMGLPVEIQRADVNGTLLNRVRVGPYAQLDDMNRVRILLGQEKIASTVVRQ